MTNGFNFTGIDGISFGIEDMDLAARFYLDWGLQLVSADSNARVYKTMDGTEINLRNWDDPALPQAIEDGSTIREVIWGVQEEKDLNTLCSTLSTKTKLRDVEGRPACTDPNGLTISFRVTQRHNVKVSGTPINSFEAPDARTNRQSTFYERAEPIDIGHVVFFVSDLGLTQSFYMDNLGFFMSDRYPGSGAFLRCKPEGGHHNLFLLQTPEKRRGLNHVAFTVRDIHEVFGGGLHVDRCGWKTQIGPGRHPISSAYFWYVENPSGGLAEYFADEDYLTQAWKPRDFDRTNENYAEWGIGGGIDGYKRRQRK